MSLRLLPRARTTLILLGITIPLAAGVALRAQLSGPAGILNNGTSAYTETGRWYGSTRGYGGTQRIALPTSVLEQTSNARWTSPTLAPGMYEVWATWSVIPPSQLGSNQLAANAPFRISNAQGQTIGQATVNQRIDPAGVQYASTHWRKLGQWQLSGVTRIDLTNQGANGVVIADAVMLVQLPSVDMEIVSTASPSGVVPGGIISYVHVVRNRGPGQATNVRLTQTRTNSAITFTTVNDPACQINTSGTQVICVLGAMPPGGQRNILVSALFATGVACPPTLIERASVLATEPDPVLTNNQSTALTTVQCPGTASSSSSSAQPSSSSSSAPQSSSSSSVVASASSAGSQGSVTAIGGLVGHWKFDETGTQALDSTPNLRHGTLTNIPVTDRLTTGIAPFSPNTGALHFRGGPKYVDVPSFTWPAGGGAVAITFWNFVTQADLDGSAGPAAFQVGNNTGDRFQAHVPYGDKNIYWDYGGAGGAGRLVADYTTYLGKWTHVALISTGNTGTFKAIYLDGQLVASAPVSNGPDGASSGLRIGQAMGGSLIGKMDDFRIYNRILSQAEVQTIAAGGGGASSAPAGSDQLAIRYAVSDPQSAVGETAPYTLEYTYSGTTPKQGQIYITFPTWYTASQASVTGCPQTVVGSADGLNYIGCVFPTMQPGAQGLVTFYLTSAANTPCGSNNTISARFTATDSIGTVTKTVTANTQDTCTTQSDLDIQSTITDTTHAILTSYSIRIENKGPNAATNVVVKKGIPGNTSQTSCPYDSPSTTTSCQRVGNDIVISIPTLAAGQVKTLNGAFGTPENPNCVEVPLADTIGSTRVMDSVTANNVSETTMRRNCGAVSPQPNLVLTATEIAAVARGAEVQYSFVVRNNGTAAADGILLRDALPPFFTSIVSMDARCAQLARPWLIGCNLESLAPGQNTNVLIRVRVLPETPCEFALVNSAQVSASVADPAGDNSTQTVTTTQCTAVPPASSSSVSVSLSSSSSSPVLASSSSSPAPQSSSVALPSSSSAGSVGVIGGLVLHLKFDENGGTTANDSAPPATNGIMESMEQTDWFSSELPFTMNNVSALAFDGSEFVGLSGFTWPTGGPVTVSFWNKVATSELGGGGVFGVGLSMSDRFGVHAPYSDRNVYWDYGGSGGNGRITANYTNYLDKWTHVTLVSAGNGGSFKAIYFDGQVAAQAATPSDGTDTPMTGMRVGQIFGGFGHKGKIDDFRIYNRVLTAAEIQGLANGTLSQAPASRLWSSILEFIFGE